MQSHPEQIHQGCQKKLVASATDQLIRLARTYYSAQMRRTTLEPGGNLPLGTVRELVESWSLKLKPRYYYI